MPIVFLVAIVLAAVQLLQAQDDCGDECRINTNLALVINVPVNASAQAVGTGWGIAGGIGYNFDRHNAVIGEFMWNRVYPSGGALKPFETALQSTDLRGHTDLYTLTGEYRFELRGRLIGAYLIGGGGWYFRNTWLSREVPSGTGTLCSPAWRWWGYTCASGIVNPNQPPVTSSTNTFGVNGGVGFTCKSRRGSLSCLHGGSLSLRPHQKHQHAVHNSVCRNPLLKEGAVGKDISRRSQRLIENKHVLQADRRTAHDSKLIRKFFKSALLVYQSSLVLCHVLSGS